MYGLSEKQFRLLFSKADRQKGVTGTNLLVALERRLDNVVYRMGFTNSRTQGRHFVRHQHFLVNGKKVNIPSYPIKIGDVVEVQEKSREMAAIQSALEAVARRNVPQWMELDKDKKRGVIKGLPVREDLTMPIQEQLIVELYSK
jgi:small subunit ribosomal protein S4